ncbi:PAS domain S-box-containing protein [Tindallia magadiensis]|uniref:Circadian input-output histidine kinase CikA n=1 Tax=Tindallia magadiensis TaxID=69895 RepID=A0A1I3AD84_9FIRM|nr:response regulator [Tindallia magadiensis]SFH48047.1 PAS domain S-box-containing protein [Tindallia magadiensis]
MLQKILDKVNIGIILLDEELSIKFWNGWLEAYSGIQKESVLEKNIMTVLPVLKNTYYQSMLKNTLTNHQNMFFSGAFHPVFIEPSPSKGIVKQNLQIEPIIENNAVWIMLQIEDITNQYRRVQTLNEKIKFIKETQEALKISEEKARKHAKEAKKANEAKSQFLAHMSHEIRTPLNGVVGFLELLKSTPLTNKQNEYLDNAQISAMSLLTIVNDILDFSKIEANKMTLDLVPSNLAVICKESIEMFRYQAEKKGLQLALEFDPNAVRNVLVDPVRLKQILINLVGNAVKFTADGSVVLKVSYTSIEQKKGCYLFEVIDTGIGISENQSQRIFDVFTQADHSTTREYGGTGLGLVISNHLAHLMSSKIKLNSKLGEGSCFYFELLLNESIETQIPDQKVNNKQTNEKRSEESLTEEISILIVDDVLMNIELVTAMIQNIVPSASISYATNGKQAIDYLRNNHYDLVLMDVQMPLMDGLEVTKEYRQFEGDGSNQVPIIALSAGVTEAEKKSCKEAGMDDFLEKPVSQSQLIKVLKKHITINTARFSQVENHKKLDHHFNIERLQNQLSYNQESLQVIIDTALAHFPEAIYNLKEAIKRKDQENIPLIVHALKGTSMNLSMDRMVSMLLEIENVLRKEPEDYWDDLKKWIFELEIEWNIVRQMMVND